MSALQDLPNETLTEIIQLAAQKTDSTNTLRNLRLVSRRLDPLTCPILFATLRLDFRACDDKRRTNNHARSDRMLIALATRATTVFKYTRELLMCTERLFQRQESNQSGIKETKRYLCKRLPDIISALKNLRSIEYLYNPAFDPDEFASDLFHALARLPCFESIDLHFIGSNRRWYTYTDMPQSMTLQPLSNLTIFRSSWSQSKPKTCLLEIASLLARCPNIIELALNQLNKNEDLEPTLHEILQDIDKLETEWKLERLILKGVVVAPEDVKDHIRHFKNLSFLEISINDNPDASTTFGQICKALQENGVFLKGVSTDHPEDPLLLQYLSSYSGLKQLSLRMENQQIENEFEIVQRIYTCILPNHLKTIEHLVIGCKSSTIWDEIPKKEHLAEIVRCRNLKWLDVHPKIDLDELRDACKNDLDAYISSLSAKPSWVLALNRAGIYFD